MKNKKTSFWNKTFLKHQRIPVYKRGHITASSPLETIVKKQEYGLITFPYSDLNANETKLPVKNKWAAGNFRTLEIEH